MFHNLKCNEGNTRVSLWWYPRPLSPATSMCCLVIFYLNIWICAESDKLFGNKFHKQGWKLGRTYLFILFYFKCNTYLCVRQRGRLGLGDRQWSQNTGALFSRMNHPSEAFFCVLWQKGAFGNGHSTVLPPKRQNLVCSRISPVQAGDTGSLVHLHSAE